MKATISMTKCMVRGDIYKAMAITMMASGKLIFNIIMESYNIQLETYMKDNGRKVRRMDKGKLHLPMDLLMKVHSKGTYIMGVAR